MPAIRDLLRSLEDMLQPDPIWQHYAVVDESTGQERRLTMADRYAHVADLAPGEAVPDDVANQFNLARRLYVLSWYSARIVQVAERHAYSTTEFALRLCLGHQDKPSRKRPTLKRLLEEAERKGLIRLDSSRREAIVSFRNTFSHGSKDFYPDGRRALEACCNIINQLYPPVRT